LVFYFNTPRFLNIRMDALIADSLEITAHGLNPNNSFVLNLIFLVKQSMDSDMPLNEKMVQFIEQHYHGVEYTIEQVMAALNCSEQPLKTDALLTLLSNQTLTKQQKSDLASMIMSAVEVVMHPEVKIIGSQEVGLLFCAIQTDATGAVRTAIANFAKPQKFFQGLVHGRESLLSAAQKSALAKIEAVGPSHLDTAAIPVNQEPEAALSEEPSKVAETAAIDIPNVDPRHRDGLAVHVLISSGSGLLAPIESMHYSASPPALPASPATEDEEGKPVSVSTLQVPS